MVSYAREVTFEQLIAVLKKVFFVFFFCQYSELDTNYITSRLLKGLKHETVL